MLNAARAASFILVNIYAAKAATVFMVSTSTIVIYTNIAPRWIASHLAELEIIEAIAKIES
ncbi:MAG: hypothetical protein HC793_02375 [Aquincola sp.]|nr:hypothetical protein [Aquincola sp.]